MGGTKKRNFKWIVDLCMCLVLLCLMAYQVCGEVLHEWGGVGMTLLLIVHHVLNRKWYASLFRGRYNAYRIVTLLVNTLLLGSIALTALCGMSMSAHAVPFLYGLLPVSFARQMHLALSYWSFVLMGFHLGLHLPAMSAAFKWNGKVKIALSLLFAAAAGLGFWIFLKNGLPDYMFFRTPFAFLDYEKAALLVFAENLAVLTGFAFLGGCCANVCKALGGTGQKRRAVPPLLLVLLAVGIGTVLTLYSGGAEPVPSWDVPQTAQPTKETEAVRESSQVDPSKSNSPAATSPQAVPADLEDGFVLLTGGSFQMGSPETENWRIEDETRHEVTVSAFYIDPYETTQAEYTRLMGSNPSAFSGDALPVESISWPEAIAFANAKSLDADLRPAYTITDSGVVWDRSANGYRLPTEAEWEYACRAGTETPFNTEHRCEAL